MKTTACFSKLLDLTKRVRILQGGTSSGKTYSILQFLIILAQKSKANLIISICSESIPHLKRGAYRDFLNILNEDEIYDRDSHNKTDNTYRIGNSLFEFFSVDQPEKVRGGRRDILFMNECNNISYTTYEQMEVRTKRMVLLDYNPEAEFWVHEKVLPEDDSEMFISTYKDNEFLMDSIVKSIEKRKPVYDENGLLVSGNPQWWRVYGEGQTGRYEGLVFKDVEIVEEVPRRAKLVAKGLDWGYSNDPTAFGAVYILNETIYIDELLYEKSLTNQDIADRFDALGIDKLDEIFADSSEPKSIEELCRRGYNVKPSLKGRDSVMYGINLMQQYKICVTKNSTNTIREFRRYRWLEDKDGNLLNKPEDCDNHMIDAVRYVIMQKEDRPKLMKLRDRTRDSLALKRLNQGLSPAYR